MKTPIIIEVKSFCPCNDRLFTSFWSNIKVAILMLSTWTELFLYFSLYEFPPLWRSQRIVFIKLILSEYLPLLWAQIIFNRVGNDCRRIESFTY